jgi:predicted AAA+ superfamily ATPase
MFSKIFEVKTSIESLTIYRGLLEDKVIHALHYIFEDLINENTDFSEFINNYCNFYYKLVQNSPESSFKHYLVGKIVLVENAFSRHSEKVCFDNINKNLQKAAERDLRCLNKMISISAREIKEAAITKFGKTMFENDIINNLPEWEIENVDCNTEDTKITSLLNSNNNWGDCAKPLADFYRQNGSGEFANFKGFVWERNQDKGYLKGISSPDRIRFCDLIGYEIERQEVINNTLQFLNGYPANNVLLYGDRGTGKSSTVKALLNEYCELGLRIIELPKAFLNDLHYVLRAIKDRQQKFIIFIDDLAFGDSEEDYTALKAVLEGGLESKPQNVVIYATSNRRHLIKEKFSDRSGLMSNNHDDEIRAADTLQEKLSLADRFGITVTFTSPDKKKFLDIVEGLARNRKLDIDIVTLHQEALKWEMYYNGRSPRTARQFIDWLEGHMSKVDFKIQ